MRVRLGEVCEINMGQSPASSTYNEEEKGLPFFQGNADFGEIYPTARIWCDEPTKVAHIGDILISVRAPIGALNLSNCKCCIGRGLAALTVNKNICLQKYLWYVLAGKNGELNSKGTGSTFKAINKNILAETEIPLPSLDEQHKIVMLLDKVSGVIAERRKQVERLDDLVKSRFIEMFGDPEYNTKNLPVFKLSKLCNVGSSKRIYQSEQSAAGIPFLRISDLNDRIDKGIETSELFLPFEKYTELHEQGLVPEFGDILVTSRGTLGKCYIVKKTDNFYFQDGMISWLSEMDENVTSLYIAHLFAMPDIQKQIANLQVGSTVAYLSIAMLKKLDIMLPPLETQHQYSVFVQQTDKLELVAQKSLEKLEILKKSLMQQYFG